MDFVVEWKKLLQNYRITIENFNILALPIRWTFPFKFELLPFKYNGKLIKLDTNEVIANFCIKYDGKNLEVFTTEGIKF